MIRSFILLILFGFSPLLALNQSPFLVEAEKTFTNLVLSDDTILEKRLFFRRYELIKKLLAKEQYEDALREIRELHEDFSGRSLFFIDYLQGRLYQKLGDDLITNAGMVYKFSYTNIIPREDLRYIYFPEKDTGRVSRTEVFESAIPYPVESRRFFDLADVVFARLVKGPVALLKEAAILAQGDLSVSRREWPAGRKQYEFFLREYPTSPLRADACFRLSRVATLETNYTLAAQWVKKMNDFFPKSDFAKMTEEKIQVLEKLAKGNADAALRPELLSAYRRELDLRQDLLGVLDRLSALR